jgi:peptidoglycan/xylan/chitin deacetylase (PgdA/CDA1 family)
MRIGTGEVNESKWHKKMNEMNDKNEIKTYAEFVRNITLKNKVRIMTRDLVVAARSIGSTIASSTNWIRMIYYHHVFDDERKDFERQLLYLKNYGEFISIDRVYQMVSGKVPIEGRYFCITFDDGFHNTYSNMMEITSRLQIPVIIYLPTDYIDTNPEELDYNLIYDRMAPGNTKLLRFLTWDQCREMLKHNITFGSHTTGHPLLSTLDRSGVEHELIESKRIIEKELGISCIHFAVPRGRTGRDFDPDITRDAAIKSGYQTVVTTIRGTIQKGDDLYLLNREHLLAKWGNYQSRFFFGKS